MTDFTVLLIATNRYTDYATTLIESIHEKLFTASTGQVLLFTDNPSIFEDSSSDRVSVIPVEIPSYGWPDATLLRYRIFAENWAAVTGDYVMYLDVDTIVASKVQLRDVFDSANKLDLAFVRHPGYFKTGPIRWIRARSWQGTWETRRRSTAFVPSWRRKTYVAGGVWIGTKEAIFQMVSQLQKNVDADLAQNIVAQWHDESHLNSWAARHEAKLLDPSWAHAPGYKNIQHLTPIIELVHKPQEFFDQRD
jgi:hypothetical protein